MPPRFIRRSLRRPTFFCSVSAYTNTCYMLYLLGGRLMPTFGRANPPIALTLLPEMKPGA